MITNNLSATEGRESNVRINSNGKVFIKLILLCMAIFLFTNCTVSKGTHNFVSSINFDQINEEILSEFEVRNVGKQNTMGLVIGPAPRPVERTLIDKISHHPGAIAFVDVDYTVRNLTIIPRFFVINTHNYKSNKILVDPRLTPNQ